MRLFLFLLVFVLMATTVLACGERDVRLVDDINVQETTTKRSACSKVTVNVDENDVVLVGKDRITIDSHAAQHILEDYLAQEYGTHVRIVQDDHSDVPGHEHHHHAGGRLQNSHGTISYAFLVRGNESFHDGKAIPLYVDAENGNVYGVGCGYGAGDVVFSPDVANYQSVFSRITQWITHAIGW